VNKLSLFHSSLAFLCARQSKMGTPSNKKL